VDSSSGFLPKKRNFLSFPFPPESSTMRSSFSTPRRASRSNSIPHAAFTNIAVGSFRLLKRLDNPSQRLQCGSSEACLSSPILSFLSTPAAQFQGHSFSGTRTSNFNFSSFSQQSSCFPLTSGSPGSLQASSGTLSHFDPQGCCKFKISIYLCNCY